MNTSCYVTTSIPYVNAAPHLGFALELVQADVLARQHRRRGRPTRLQSGTDDNALKNAGAARAAGIPTATFVDRNAARFAALADRLDVSLDDYLRTSVDPRHRAGVERLWQISAARGDFYRQRYAGLYCAGCEQFFDPAELVDGDCPEHPGAVEATAEVNWFFRLSRYVEPITAALSLGQVRIEPVERRNEVLSFLRTGLTDISVSRPAARSEGWGVPVPGDHDQVVYVWWDALANYVTALGDPGSDAYRTWWSESSRRVHVIGKGIVRFHAVYWLGLLLSTGQRLPTEIFVHPYLTVDGAKISKSTGAATTPEDLLDRHGVDAVRWWLLSDVSRLGDTDFTEDRLVRRYHQDLLGGIGNLVHRVCTLVHRSSGRLNPSAPLAPTPAPPPVAELTRRVQEHLDSFDLRAAAAEIIAAVAWTNRFLEDHRPWELARASDRGDDLAAILATSLACCRTIAAELQPFVPGAAGRLLAELDAAGTRRPRRAFRPLDGPSSSTSLEL